jgi:hypothetical protein
MTIQDPILLLRISMGKQNNFSKNNWQFEHALSKRFDSSGLVLSYVPGTSFPSFNSGCTVLVKTLTEWHTGDFLLYLSTR